MLPTSKISRFAPLPSSKFSCANKSNRPPAAVNEPPLGGGRRCRPHNLFRRRVLESLPLLSQLCLSHRIASSMPVHVQYAKSNNRTTARSPRVGGRPSTPLGIELGTRNSVATTLRTHRRRRPTRTGPGGSEDACRCGTTTAGPTEARSRARSGSCPRRRRPT